MCIELLQEAPPPVNAGVDVNVSISPTSGAALYATDPAEKATHSIAPDDRASKGQEASPQLAATVTATVELQPAAKRRRLSMVCRIKRLLAVVQGVAVRVSLNPLSSENAAKFTGKRRRERLRQMTANGSYP